MKKDSMRKGSIRFFTALIIVMIITSGVLMLNKSTIQAEESVCLNKYYKTVEIEYGDTIWKIAENNIPENSSIEIRDYVREVKQINSLDNDKITSGMKLIVPYYAE